MSDELVIEGKSYIPSKQAAEVAGYTQDYIGQLARGGQIQARRVSGMWYISLESLNEHKTKAESYVPQPPRPRLQTRREEDRSAVSFDGKSYVSAARAAKITGYHQDYVSQLAREGKILARQIAGKWYVDQEGIQGHKNEKDALLGAVQAQAVGIVRLPAIEATEKRKEEAVQEEPVRYFSEEKPLMPFIQDKPENIVIPAASLENSFPELSPDEEPVPEFDVEHAVPIRIIRSDGVEKQTYVPNKKFEQPGNSSEKRRNASFSLAKSLFLGVPALTIVVVVAFSWSTLGGTPKFAAEDGVARGFVASAGAAGGNIFAAVREMLTKEIGYTR